MPQARPVDSSETTLHITLQDAIERAKKQSPALDAALADAKIAAEATVQARAANLPNVSGVSQYLYTEGNGTLAARFIANNGVHEYIAQADVHQAISAPLLIEYRRSAVLRAVARDQATIAERGLVVAVVQAYATVYGAEGKQKTGEESLRAAQNFLKMTEERERNGDAAHADVLKARIQADDSQSALANAQLVSEQARIALALLIFRNVNQPFDLADDPSQTLTLPPFSQAQKEAGEFNPEVDAASKSRQAAHQNLDAARAGYLPALTFDYYYGIDANQFATDSTLYDGKQIQNLGYSAQASLSVPIFTWGATHSKVKEAKAQEDVAQANVDYARRKAAGDLEQFYQEAQVAGQDLKTRQEAYADAVESRRLTLLQYQSGVATALEVVSAQTTVESESGALYDAKTRYATALATLATLTGDL
jgi:outer membrane protein TolC